MDSPPAMRPRFEAVLTAPREQLLARVRARLNCCEPRVHAQMADHHVELLIDTAQRHYWSPWLSVTIDDHDLGAVVKGRFGPHPSVWTMFMSIHIFLVLGGLSAGIYGFTAWSLGHSAWPLLLVPTAGVLMVLTYLAALIGQRYGASQMWLLHAALDDMLGHETKEAAYLEP